MRKTKVKFASRISKHRRVAVTNRRQPRHRGAVVHEPVQSEAERRACWDEINRGIVQKFGPSAFMDED